MNKPPFVAIVSPLIPVLASLAVADAATGPATRIALTNTARAEYYQVTGDRDASPYQHEGWHPYNEIQAFLSRRESPYSIWRLTASGVVGDSDYRTPEESLLLERINLLRERGDASVPYRIEAGDYYGFFSPRTLQTSLKGIRVELQPRREDNTGIRHSFMFLGGARRQSWNGFSWKEHLSGGISYLLETDRGRYAYNMVYSKRYADPAAQVSGLDQVVTSLAGEQEIFLGSLPLLLEGELGYFDGDRQDIAGPESGADKSGTGLFLQLRSGRPAGFSFRLRHENYGKHYAPEGAAVTPDRRTYEAHLGYRSGRGLRARFRLQRFEDSVHTAKSIADVVGLNLLGSFAVGSPFPSGARTASANIDMFLHKTRPEAGEVTTNKVINANLLAPLLKDANARVALGYADGTNSLTRSLRLAIDMTGRPGQLQSTVSPYLGYRKAGYPTYDEDISSAGVSWSLEGETRSLHANLACNRQHVSAGADVLRIEYGLTFQQRLANHQLALGISGTHRNPDSGEATSSYKVTLRWTYHFGGELGKKKKAAPVVARVSAPGWLTPGMFTYLHPGQPTADILSLLEASRAGGHVRSGNVLLYETRIFEEIERRQRLVVVDDAGMVAKIAIVFDPAADTDVLLDNLRRVNEALMRQYGTPAAFYEKGKASAALARDIENGDFTRIYEWALPGGTLRLGVPARTDGTVRIEVQYAEHFPSPTYPFWGLETVR